MTSAKRTGPKSEKSANGGNKSANDNSEKGDAEKGDSEKKSESEKSENASKPRNDDGLLAAAREVLIEADHFLNARHASTDRLRGALETLRKYVPAPPAPKPPKRGAPLTQDDWDARVLAWAADVNTSITLDRALTALAPETAIGSDEHNAIAASLNRLPRNLFDISWYLANATLAPKWTKRST